MVSCKRIGAHCLAGYGINQTATHITAFIELMLDYITKMEVESSADLASKGSKGKILRYHAMQHVRTGTVLLGEEVTSELNICALALVAR